VTITARSGAARASKKLTVLSPIAGSWERKSQPLKGMRIKIEAYGDAMVGTITRPPPADAENAAHYASQPGFTAQYGRDLAECAQKGWSTGLQKLKDIKRVGDKKWSALGLTKDVRENYRCIDRPGGSSRIELVSVGPDTLELADTTTHSGYGALQTWARVPE
jgi:hypothetical protein